MPCSTQDRQERNLCRKSKVLLGDDWRRIVTVHDSTLHRAQGPREGNNEESVNFVTTLALALVGDSRDKGCELFATKGSKPISLLRWLVILQIHDYKIFYDAPSFEMDSYF